MAIVGLGFANAEVPAVFVLGDSTADVGTNNFLPGFKARADFPPNGIDFPSSRPTGRFSNGFNSADFLVHDNHRAIKGSAYTEILFSRSLFFISIGSNDLLSYFYSNSSVPKQEFISANLGLEYEKQITSILELGARKIGITSVPPVGCCPSQKAFNESGGCLEGLNDLALEFHSTINESGCCPSQMQIFV
uniref:GDSL esterase/lipase n=1 Tax=Populus alba TaxID=43335 RepID=A0A4U5NLF9_POPAL|nr:hypothetical protein D5086_0000269080 [Populus alba]